MELFECNGVLVRLKVTMHHTAYEVLVEHVRCGRYWMDEVCEARTVFEATVPFSEQSRKDYELMTAQLRHGGNRPTHDSDKHDTAVIDFPETRDADTERREHWLRCHGKMNAQLSNGQWRLVTKKSFDLSKWVGYAPRIVTLS